MGIGAGDWMDMVVGAYGKSFWIALVLLLLLLFSNEVGIKVIGPKRMGKR